MWFNKRRYDNMSVEELIEALQEHDKSVQSFYEDPMTEAMGAPTGDFQEGFDAEERLIICLIFEKAPHGSEEWEMACGRLEKWMP